MGKSGKGIWTTTKSPPKSSRSPDRISTCGPPSSTKRKQDNPMWQFFGGTQSHIVVETELARWRDIRALMLEINTLVRTRGYPEVDDRLHEIEAELEALESLDGQGRD